MRSVRMGANGQRGMSQNSRGGTLRLLRRLMLTTSLRTWAAAVFATLLFSLAAISMLRMSVTPGQAAGAVSQSQHASASDALRSVRSKVDTAADELTKFLDTSDDDEQSQHIGPPKPRVRKNVRGDADAAFGKQHAMQHAALHDVRKQHDAIASAHVEREQREDDAPPRETDAAAPASRAPQAISKPRKEGKFDSPTEPDAQPPPPKKRIGGLIPIEIPRTDAKATVDTTHADKTAAASIVDGVDSTVDSARASTAAVDISIRCKTSSICEHETTTTCRNAPDPVLACMFDAQQRQQRIKDAIAWSWEGYVKGAWGADELLPMSSKSSEWFGLGLTLVDSLDTLMLAGLHDQAQRARVWIIHDLKLAVDKKVNLFETTIRVLGGLLAAFHIGEGDVEMLKPAIDLALRLQPAFNTQTGIPYSDVNLAQLAGFVPAWTSSSSLSEATTLSLEYSYLAHVIQRKDIAAPAMQVWKVMHGLSGQIGGLAPIFVDPISASFTSDIISFGARGDSYYEYMLKQWILSNHEDALLLDMYKTAIRTLRDKLVERTAPAPHGLLYISELHNGRADPKFDHLVCFLPGLLALGHLHGVTTAQGEHELDDLQLAEELMRTCYELYRRTPVGLAPEIAFFQKRDVGNDVETPNVVGGGDFAVKQHDSHNLLRPETVESLFVLWRVTKKPVYREWGWKIFRAFEMHCKWEQGGYTNLDSVLQVPAPRRDKMESFWIAETLKYLWLLFSDDDSLLPLTQYVFNTEAHPLPVPGRTADQQLSRFYPRFSKQGEKLQSSYDADTLRQQIEWYRSSLDSAAARVPAAANKVLVGDRHSAAKANIVNEV